MITKIQENIHQHHSTEKRSLIRNDKILTGFLNLTERILRISPQLCRTPELKNFANYLFDVCLFSRDPRRLLDNDLNMLTLNDNMEFNPPDYVKCKHGDSRHVCYTILQHIVRENQDILSDTL